MKLYVPALATTLVAANVILGTVAEGTVINEASPPAGAVTATLILRVPHKLLIFSVAVKGDI